MAIIKKSDLAAMDANALAQKENELELEIRREKGAIATAGKPSNSGKFREMKRLRATIKMLLSKKAAKTAKK
ncbi:MAG: 50S ribosomal protein L29 [Candidatus Micrarchaeia archaeon]|jgi:large subunit ribosomal protein L29